MSLVLRKRPGLIVALLVLISGAGSMGATHTIKAGDTLYSLARQYKTSVAKFQEVNGIKDVTKLKIGQQLTIPGSSSSSQGASKTAAKPASQSGSKSTAKSSGSRAGAGKRVVIDPGHGGKDWGAYRGGIKESYLNMRVATKLESNLKERGYTVSMTRRSDTFVSLSRRAALANRYGNTVFVSIHFNSTRSSSVRGVETFYAGAAGRSLAASIQREMIRRCKVRNRGIRFARFTVLVQTKCPAVLVECGFISNPSERARCATNAYQSTVALAIADGIANYRWR